MIKKFISNAYKKVSRISIVTLLIISGSGVAPLMFSSTAHANILGPVNGIYINEFSSYGDEDWIELQNKNGNSVSLNGLSIRFHDPSYPQINLEGYILGDGFIKLDVGNKLNRDGGAFSLSDGSSSQLINYGNTTNIGYKVTGAPGNGQVSARMESYNGFTWIITSAATPGKHNNPTVPTPTIISPVHESVQQTKNVTFSWQPVERAFHYPLSVSSDPNFLQSVPLNSNGVNYALNATVRTYTLEEGTYYWRVKTMRDGLLSPWSEVHKFTVNLAAPIVTFTHPSPVDGSYVINDFDVSVTAHDSSKLDSVTISLLDDDNLEPSERWKAGCSYTDLDTSDLTRTCRMQLPADLPDGTYTLQIDGQDQAGINAVSQSRTIHIDRTKPEIPALIGPTDSIVTRSNSITHTWTDSSNDVDHYVFESYDDAEAIQKQSSEKVTTTSITSQHAEDVTYWWRVKAIDRAGHIGDWSELRKVTIDNTAPTIEFTHPSPADGSYINSDFDVSVLAHDSNKLDTVKVSLLDDDNLESGERLKAGCNYPDLDVSELTRTCRIELPTDLPDGTYTVQIDGQDKAGISAISQSRTIHIDRTKPEASMLIEPSNDLVTRGYSIAHTWTESSSTDVDHYVFERYDDAEATRKLSSEKTSNTSITSTYTEDVTYWWRVKAVDRASNESNWSELRKVTLDNTAPTFKGETNHTMLTGKKLTLAPIVDEENVTYKWTLGDNKKNILTDRNSSLTDPTLTIGNLPKGEYSVTLVLTDQVGNATDPIEYHITVNTPSLFRHIVGLIFTN